MTENQQMFQKVTQILNKIRPYLQQDGGDVELIKIEAGIVYVKMLGACQGCSLFDVTLYDGIERALVENVAGVIGVVPIEEERK